MSIEAAAVLEKVVALLDADVDRLTRRDKLDPTGLSHEDAERLDRHARVLPLLVRAQRPVGLEDDDFDALLEKVRRDPALMDLLKEDR